MKFGSVPIAEAEGAMLVHGQTLANHRYRKGDILDASDIERLQSAGIDEITVAIFEDGDVDENSAAQMLAEAAAGPGVRIGVAGTGRVNLFAEHDGLAGLDPDMIDRVNAIDEGITISTLRPYDRVEQSQIVATIKIIPYAVSDANLARAAEEATRGGKVSALPYLRRQVALVQTNLPGLQAKVTEKTEEVMRDRIEALGSELTDNTIVAHASESIAEKLTGLVESGSDLILVIGASATVDRRDVIPSAIEQAGGEIAHFGMPVDPGNLLVLAFINDVPVLALPGSARSRRPGGNDIVLERIMAGVSVGRSDIMGLGVGGLLKEIPSRPLPRSEAAPRSHRQEAATPRFAAVILAAGQSRRMGAINKLLIPIDGKPMIRHTIDAVRGAGADPIIVVTGHAPEDVQAAAGDNVNFVHNPDFNQGLSTSLRVGVSAIPDTCDGTIIGLGDMPRVGPDHVRALMGAYDPDEGHLICVPTVEGKRGNPVLWDRRFFEDMTMLGGDVGAKHLIGDFADAVKEVPMPDSGVLLDIDSPAALEQFNVDGTPKEK